MSKIKIVYILSASWGGIPHYTTELANAVSKYAKVYVVKPDDSNDELFNENVNIIHGFKPIMFSRKEILKSFSIVNIKNILSYKNINTILNKIQPDIVHLTEVYPYIAIYIKLYKIDKRFPLVCTLHAAYKSFIFSPQKYGVCKSVVYSVAEFLKRLIDPKMIIVHTERDKKILIKRGINSNKIAVVPHGAYTLFKKSNSSITEEDAILFFGFIQENKGVEYLLKSMPIVHKEMPNVRLIIAGEGDLSKYSNLINKIERSKLEIYNEFIPNDMVDVLFKRAKVIVLPYIFHEGHSGVLTIALSYGKPVVITNVGDLPTMIENGKEGIVVPPKDPESLAEAILTILKDDELRKKMSKNALKRAEELSWDNIAKKHIEIYKKLIKKCDKYE